MSHWLFLDRPAKYTAVALGRPDPGPTGEQTVVVVVPTPAPTRGPKPGEKGDKPVKPLQERPLPKPFKGHPMHLYIAGDSMMGLPGMALTNLSNKTKLIKPLLDYHISTGLVRPDAFNWPAQLQSQVKAFDPGAVVVMFGANDNQPVQTPRARSTSSAATAGRRSTASACRTSSVCCSRAACAASTGSASRSCRRRRSTIRSS